MRYAVVCEMFLASSYDVIGIFTSREDAQKEYNKHSGDTYTSFDMRIATKKDIEIWENSPQINLKKEQLKTFYEQACSR